MNPKRTLRNRLAIRVRIVFIGLLVLTVVLMLIAGNYVYDTISSDFSRRLSRQYSIEAAANFLSSTNTHFVLAHQLAHSPSVSRWVAHKDNEDYKAEALNRIEDYASFAPNISLRVTFYDSFFTSYLGTGFTAAEFDLSDGSIMGEGVGSDWFFDTRDAELPFNLNIQRSRARHEHFTLYVWTNHRIYHEGRFVGIMTVGSPFSYVFDDMFGNFDATYQRGYIVDKYGMVRVDSAGLLQVFDDGWSTPLPPPEADNNPERAQAWFDAHMLRMEGGAFRPGTEVFDAIDIQGDYSYASIAPIIGTNWSVAVLSAYPGFWGGQYLLLSVFVLVGLIVIVWIGSRLIRKVVITPLYNLTQSTADIGVMENTEIFGLKRDDEIGDLARTIKQSQEDILAAKYAMHMDARLYAMLDASPILCAVFDANNNILEVNQAVAEMFELPDKQTFIDRFYDFCPEFQSDGTPSRDKVPPLIALAFEEGSVKSEWILQTMDGKTQIPCELYLKRVELEGSSVVMAYARDLREQRAMMNNLRHREELLSATNHAAEILLTSVGEEDSMAAIAKGMEIIGQSVDADRVLLWRNETIDGELCFVMRNNWIRSPDIQNDGLNIGESFPYSSNPGWLEMFSRGEIINSPISKLPREQANFLGTYGVKSIVIIPLFIDGEFFGRLSVSDCRRERVFSDMEVDIIRSAGMMFVNTYNLVEQSAEIKAAVAKAEDANNAKSRFLARMSHEIRTPMNGVMGIAEIQLQKGSHPTDIEDAFLRIHHSSNLLLSIVNDILDLSQVEAGKTEIIQKEYETADMIVETVQLNVMHIGTKSIDFKLSIDENIPRLMEGDEIRIKQVMNNLLSNAFKYTEEGVVTLSLRREEFSQENIMLVIEVADTGQGISEAQLNTLFETEFNRLNLHQNRDIEGTGLGMTITSHLVNLMGGKISAESTPGKGSVFSVRIPQKIIGDEVLGSTAARLQNIDSVKESMKKITIMEFEVMHGKVLVVDDVETNLYVAKGMLEPYELAVETASSGFEAVEMIKNGSTYDIIFMDHMMPDMDGIEATKHIRGTGYDLPIVALTANSLAGQKEMFLENGFNDFISKPIVANKLDKCLKKFIRTQQTVAVSGSPPSAALIASFLRDADKAAKALAEIIHSDSLGEENIKLFILNTHAMKSALYNIGENALAEAADALEEAGRTNNVEKIRAEAPDFLNSLAETVEKLTPEKLPDTPDEDLDLLRRQLNAIFAACENYDKKASKEALGALAQKSWSNKTQEILNEITTALLHSDFEAAAAAAREGLLAIR